MHPLQPDITSLSDKELEDKISELTKKYFQAVRFVPGVANQISSMLEGYRWEQQRRIIAKEMSHKNDTGFEDLIKID